MLTWRYWVVLSLLAVTERLVDLVLSEFPLYSLVKLIVLLWCILPITSNGTDVIFQMARIPIIILKGRCCQGGQFRSLKESSRRSKDACFR
jgi:hypothetical protein